MPVKRIRRRPARFQLHFEVHLWIQAEQIPLVWGELNTVKLPWKPHSFDAVLAETEFISKGRISECLAEDGIFIDNDDEGKDL